MFFVYVLRSLKNGRLYAGSTQDYQKRIAEHNYGHSIATRQSRPFELLFVEEYATRSKAVRRERFLKTGLGRQEVARLIKP